MGKLVATAALVTALGVAYFGNVCGVANKVEELRYGNSAAAQGFYDRPYELKIDVMRNGRGELEAYLLTPENRLPALQGVQGVQIGTADYAWQNLQPEQQLAYVAEGFEKLDSAKKGGLVAKSWQQLDKGTRYELVKNDLGVLVEGFIEGVKSGFR